MANWRERLRELWDRYQSKRKFIIAGIIAVLILAFAGISFWYGSKPEYVPLYTNLETKDAGDVVNSLKEAGVPYELLEDKKGATILVPATQVHNLRLDLAAAGLPRGNKGFELFDDSKLGVTEFQNKVNYIQALQGELTRTIEHLGSVDKARVHIVLPEDSLYKKNEKPATASILLMLAPETKLTQPEVKGIVNLVSHSVQGLAPENITIVDEQGNILNKNDDDELERQNAQNLRTLNQIEMTKKVRDHIQQNIQTMLDKTLGEGNAFVPLAECRAAVYFVEDDMAHMRIAAVAFHNLTTSIRRAVIQQDKFKVQEGLVQDALNALLQEGCVVIVGDDDGNVWHRTLMEDFM